MVKRNVGKGYVRMEKQILRAYKKAGLRKPSKKVIRDTIDKILNSKKIKIKRIRGRNARKKKSAHK